MQLSPQNYVNIVRLLKAAAIATAVFSVSTVFDQLHRYLELFSHFRLQYLIASTVLMLPLIGLRIRGYAILMVVSTAINAVPVVPWYIDSDARSANIEASISVIHANVRRVNDDYRSLTEFIIAEQPDIVFLQEVNNSWMSALVALHKDYPHRYAVPRDDNFGIAVLSRHPFNNVAVLDSPPLGFPTLVVHIEFHGKAVTLVSTHPMQPIGKEGFDARNVQLADIGDYISEIDGPKVLIADLNTSQWSNHYRDIEASTGLRNASVGFGVIPTWPTIIPFAMIPIDHCLVSAQISVVDIRSGPDIGSDHLPLIVTLALP